VTTGEHRPNDDEREIDAPSGWRIIAVSKVGPAGWRIYDPSGAERGRYIDSKTMAYYFAAQMAEADRLAELLKAECATSSRLLALWCAFFSADDEAIRLFVAGLTRSDAVNARDDVLRKARQLVKKLTEG
jgi:hypothetical protein